MSSTERKKREFDLRERRILQTVRHFLLRDGYLALNMDRIAAAIEYAKGTVYLHFANKEEIVVALVIETAERRVDLFQRAAGFPGKTRERMLAMGLAAELFAVLFPEHLRLEQIIRVDSITRKASAERQQRLRELSARCMGLLNGIVEEAVARGDIVRVGVVSPAELVFGLWSITTGAQVIVGTGVDLDQKGVANPQLAIRSVMGLLLDGLGWRPLSVDYDYREAAQRIAREIFPEHAGLLVRHEVKKP